MSIIIVLSGSTRTEKSALKPPLCSHVHATLTCPCSLPCARRPKNDQTAPANATNTDVVETHAAATRGRRVPPSVISTVPASGARRQSHAPGLIRAAPRGGRRPARGCGGGGRGRGRGPRPTPEG